MRARWRILCKDAFLLVLGVLVGLFVSQLSNIIHCSDDTAMQEQQLMIIKNKDSFTARKQETASISTHNNDSVSSPVQGLRIRTNQHQIDNSQPRPKYLKDELKLRDPLYVGVITAINFLNSRARDINGTWGHKLPKVDYFVAEGQGPHPLSVVSLKGVDDTYPPQKKVYRMLRYMHDNYVSKFNWFLRADDDAYIRVPELLAFLSRLDPSEPLYIGSPGLGRAEDLERIKLFPHERYCMGGPGVIFSRALLIQLVPHLDDCLEKVVVSYNEDLEVGRCISRRLGIQCTWAYEMRKLFYMDYTKGEMFKDAKVYRDKTFLSAITAHPFKSSDLLYRVHQFFLEAAIKDNEKSGLVLKKELENVQKRTKKMKAFP